VDKAPELLAGTLILPRLLSLLALFALACGGGSLVMPPAEQEGGADAATSAPDATADANLLLPDLETLEPQQVHVQTSPLTGEREMRFQTIVLNKGAGPLTLLGNYDPKSDSTHAYQIISSRDGTEKSRFAGAFVFHATHNHWHFEDFTQFELWSYRPGGRLDALVAGTGKLTFCIFDTVPVLDDATTEPAYPGCGNEFQGISIGWGDIYEAIVPGQHIDLTGVPDGRYAFRSTTDPDNLLVESDDGNNSVVVYIEINGLSLRFLDEP
jgi:hypothetical protein